MVAVLCLLGEVTVSVDGRPVDLGPAKQRRLLAVLAVEAGRVVPVDRLVGRVWGADLPLRTRATLHGYISRLRRALAHVDGVAIERRSGGYTLTTAPTKPLVDLYRFRELRDQARERAEDNATAARLLTEALQLWRGPALTGVDGEWAEAERERLEQERLAAHHDLADARLRLGQGADLVFELAARVAEHPLDERVAGQYLLALHQAGRTADALEHYRLLRERLVEELGTDPGAALRDLHRRILAADPALATPAAPPVAPAQLPAAPALFTGRTAQLADLDRVLANPDGRAPRDGEPTPVTTVVISAISGTGGIGKTWLALTWAHRNLARFPDGQLSVDLRGFSPGEPQQATDVLADFLAALGVDRDRQPQELDARAALYRTHTTGKRLLILLDNAATPDQVVPLLPGGTGCTVLITSRHRLPALLTRHSARPLNVDVLTDTEARTLLTTALGEPRPTTAAAQAITGLIGLCGGFPLALGLIAARIRTHPRLLDDLLGELHDLGLDALDSDDPDASLPTVLSWSLRHLTETQRTTFALLGIAPGPDIDAPAAASLTGLPVRDTRTALRALADASLITHAPGDRYTMHDLVRRYAATIARTTLPEAVRKNALERVVDFYLDAAQTADDLLNPHRPPSRATPPPPGSHPLPDLPAALAWLDAHHPHLLNAQHTAATHDRHQVVWSLARALTTFHRRRGHRHDALAVWRTALDAADKLPDPTAPAYVHRLLGQAHAQLEQHERATEHLHRALALADQLRDPTLQAHTHQALARAWELRGDDHQALRHAQHALSFYRTLETPLGEALALNAVGWYAARLGDHDTARTHCQAALALHRRHHDIDGEADTLDSLGYIDHRTGHHQRAIDQYRQALDLYRGLGNTIETAKTLDNLGHPHLALGGHARAREVWQEAVRLYREQGRHTDAARLHRQLAEIDGNRLAHG